MKNQYEVIIIGGSYAGLSAAMALGRASRKVLVIDSGKPCNRQTPHSHNFLTRDGETPAALASIAKEQVLNYPSVTFITDKATDAKKTDVGFEIKTESEELFICEKLLLAAGIKDIMPDIDGFADCWGISVIHCPYCHGYEVKGQKTAIFANGDAAYHYSMLLQQWTKELTIFTNGKANFTEEQMTKFEKHNISVVENPIAKLEHKQGQLECIVLENGERYDFSVMYAKPEFKQHCDITEKMNLLNDNGYVKVDEMQRTIAEGIYAVGDCTTPMRAVAAAVASGTMAGAVINNDMAAASF
ncbi:NAD(P)/FAD-dependent oxidoreductase [Flavobacterium salilacus subsp. salilacus]|uniref:NAD(P)/FAD-dependent oxidoreductase n=1 Tax=Flavobacterium TaxID=237 RepID=UPI0010753728|nr:MULTISPECIES: NAD(P)/FAD-dependent oxidoreductase [Flavobacterium]KAF2516824.1 NAD(P)/FAD-dependent oxidoreductase [Flavobacterium salilacus subsp. salilacus]MBE1615817.1 NAD(P)/FAD-dependent oxidoreductase [Flavobacterium sp. SaA2.13]